MNIIICLVTGTSRLEAGRKLCYAFVVPGICKEEARVWCSFKHKLDGNTHPVLIVLLSPASYRSEDMSQRKTERNTE